MVSAIKAMEGGIPLAYAADEAWPSVGSAQ